MSRMEKKRELRKNKRYVKLLLMMLLFLLISGIFATDFAMKDMMALYDGGQLFVYQRQGNIHNFEVFGDKFYIDQKGVIEGLKASLQWGKEHTGSLIKKLKELLNQMSG